MSRLFTSPDFAALLDYLYGLRRLGIKVGLEHTRRLLRRCGNPHERFPSLHIAGTNGKGSTAAMLASILQAHGLKVGLYTSPHLLRFNERIRVNGLSIDDETITNFIEHYRPHIDRIEATFFETTTALAFTYFAQQEVDVAVVETGLGGRLDSTNVLTPRVVVITRIHHDHRELLGSDLTSIAKEKAGIMKPGVPVVWLDQMHYVNHTLTSLATETNTPSIPVSPQKLNECTIEKTGTSFSWKGEKYWIPLLGYHQVENAALACEAAHQFDADLPSQTIRLGLRRVQWPGRLQHLETNYPLYYDVGHNANGIEQATQTLAQLYGAKPWGLMALKGDKELELIAPVLSKRLAGLAVTSVPDTDLLPAHQLWERLKRQGLTATPFETFADSVAWLKSQLSEDTPGLIFGSHYLAETIFYHFSFFL